MLTSIATADGMFADLRANYVFAADFLSSVTLRSCTLDNNTLGPLQQGNGAVLWGGGNVQGSAAYLLEGCDFMGNTPAQPLLKQESTATAKKTPSMFFSDWRLGVV
jgi:hypothetical protein